MFRFQVIIIQVVAVVTNLYFFAQCKVKAKPIGDIHMLLTNWFLRNNGDKHNDIQQ